jgi:hypothetical protein
MDCLFSILKINDPYFAFAQIQGVNPNRMSCGNEVICQHSLPDSLNLAYQRQICKLPYVSEGESVLLAEVESISTLTVIHN